MTDPTTTRLSVVGCSGRSLDFEEVATQDDPSLETRLRGFDPHLIGDLRIIGGHQVREHECLDTSGLRDPSGIFCRRLVGKDALLQRDGVGDAADETVDSWRIHYGVNEDIGAEGKLDQIVRWRGVARDHDRSVASIEPS